MTLGNKAELRKTDCYFRTCDVAGAFAARYDYDAFGNLVASSGPMADFFPHRFSTKCYDPDLGLYYYGYRWYSPELGRGISRDPIEEEGGENLFSFVCNATQFTFDLLGCNRFITGGLLPQSFDENGYPQKIRFGGENDGRRVISLLSTGNQ